MKTLETVIKSVHEKLQATIEGSLDMADDTRRTLNIGRSEAYNDVWRDLNEIQPLQIMGLAEVADRMGWTTQYVTVYLKRAEAKDFPAGMLPKPFQRIASGWLWDAAAIEAYAAEREEKAARKQSDGEVAE